jgi:hypothetical protein
VQLSDLDIWELSKPQPETVVQKQVKKQAEEGYRVGTFSIGLILNRQLTLKVKIKKISERRDETEVHSTLFPPAYKIISRY